MKNGPWPEVVFSLIQCLDSECYEHGSLLLLSNAVCSPARRYEPPSSKLVPLEVDGLLVLGTRFCAANVGRSSLTLNQEAHFRQLVRGGWGGWGLKSSNQKGQAQWPRHRDDGVPENLRRRFGVRRGSIHTRPVVPMLSGRFLHIPGMRSCYGGGCCSLRRFLFTSSPPSSRVLPTITANSSPHEAVAPASVSHSNSRLHRLGLNFLSHSSFISEV